MSSVKLCPCDSNKSYLLCCGPYHKGKIHAPTAEILMRSRFSAYVLNNPQYIYRTWDKNTRPPLTVLRKTNSQIFTELEIMTSTKGQVEDKYGTVEFIASYIDENEDSTNGHKTIQQHHENSYFVKHQNKWKYVNELSKINVDDHK